MKMISKARWGVSMLAVVQMASAGAAMAQTAPAPAPTNETAPAQEQWEDEGIVVTAQRRDERLQDVPIAISVIGGASLEDNAIGDLTELATRVPNLSFQRSPVGRGVLIRGMGSGTGNISLEQSVAMFVDGVYGGIARQFNAPFLDVERVEVLRGPQGALVGKNTVAGAINIMTRRPDDEFGGFVNANYDFELDGPSIEAGVNVPLAEGLAVRIVGQYTDQEGHLYNTETDRDEPTREEFIGRISLGYESGPFRAYAKYERSDLDGIGSPAQAISVRLNRPAQWVKSTRTTLKPEIDSLTSDNAVLQFDYDFDWATLTSITGYSGFTSLQYIDGDVTEVVAGEADLNVAMDQYSQEFRIVSATGNDFDYAGGLLFQTSDILEERTSISFVRPTSSSYRLQDQKTDDFSAYVQAGYNFGAFRLQGSLRYTHVRKTANFQFYAGLPATVAQYMGTLTTDFDGELTNNFWDPSVTLQYRPTDTIMLYTSYQQGSKSGGFQGAISNAVEANYVFEPETSESFEAGARFDLRRLGYVNLTGYHTTYSNLQITTAFPSPDGFTAPFFTGNAAESRTVGVELEMLLRLTPEFELSGGGAWNPTARYLDFPLGPCGPGQPQNTTPVGTCDNGGQRLRSTPRWLGTLTAAYNRDIGSDLKVSLSGTANYQSRQRQSTEEDPNAYQDGHVKFDARIAIGASDGRWEVGLVGRNLTNELTFQQNGTGGTAAAVLGSPDVRTVLLHLPRQVLLTGSFKF